MENTENIKKVANDVAATVYNKADDVKNTVQNLGNDAINKVKQMHDNTVDTSRKMADNVKIVSMLLCSPAIVYLAIGGTALGTTFIEGMDAHVFGLRLVKLVLWTYCLNVLCKNGYTGISWLIVIVPYLLIPIQLLGLLKFRKEYLHLFLSKDEQLFFGI